MIKKRIYLGLLAATMLLFAGALGYIWLTFFQQDGGWLRYITIVAVVAVLACLIVIGLGFAGIVLSLVSEKNITFLNKPMNFTFSLLYPVVMWLGKAFKITQDKIQRSFVEVNNQLVKAKQGKLTPDRLLILLPHCLQERECPNRITTNTENCTRCGRCPVGDLLPLSERYGVHLRIATGGTLAREAVKKLRPRAIVAVACERDLTSGILDCIPLPVLGVTNDRPHGPCFNTYVDPDAVEKAILFFIQGGDESDSVRVSAV
ncbi:DUF116 domain-containing protein [Dethiobacter alkaliphilus]|uniref:DUF116 domain-containing protein n=1 Tax=Dethiobacter alkaliphilus TaxID=427926 RepID=UPI0022262036|nr:DUF116 domain-containing protein [Dethiobacter alkaliphilus]MCW3490898.1 DUF116 domain-containing protein [Dethiobacter alkaliphilus]